MYETVTYIQEHYPSPPKPPGMLTYPKEYHVGLKPFGLFLMCNSIPPLPVKEWERPTTLPFF
jgi:hypothetical protein